MKTVVGMFNTVGEAQRTIDELIQLGFGPKDISVVTNLSAQRAMGGRLSLAPIESLDVGRVAACGPIADTMKQSTGGGNGLTGTLQYFGLTPKLAEHYARGVQHGETLESLTVEDKDADRVVAIMEKHARLEHEASLKAGAPIAGAAAAAAAGIAREVETRKEMPKQAAPMREPLRTDVITNIAGKEHLFGKDEERHIPIMREELRVGKREVERGGVHVSVHVKETPVNERINLREEHVEIERRAVDRAPRNGESVFRGEEMEFSEYGEEAVVEKGVRVVEEVIVHKRTTGHDEVVTDTLRATEVDIDHMRDFDRGGYKKHFDSLNLKGSTFDEYLPAYELGHRLRASKASRWEEIESQAKTNWENARPGTWDRFKDTIRYAWARARNL
ncbi:Tenebrin [Labilithrix luteola]|uniref:Tenebrin n=1 Tax=Labilithrix luteola TaxID=1391654 RepID=A0A0K1PS40_9BACT|nr:YsnF/AvaK domain-containing protein [Labilithrix luteola]AKU95944.1 Tenebrin [Labilithrix luteola]